MGSIRRRGPASSPLLAVAAVAAVFVSACSFDWEGYDPRLAPSGGTGATGPGTGGAGGDAGAGGAGLGGMGGGGMGGGMGGGGPPPGGLRLQYKTANAKAEDIQVQPHFKIVNDTQDTVPLSDLTIRYWFTRDGGANFIYDCDFAPFNCIHTSGTFGVATGVKADTYLTISFTPDAGVLVAGDNSGEIQARLHTQNFTTVNQTNDYSFDPMKVDFAEWSKVTLYSKGVLVWGNEP
ncbi:cellulose binding domain-containing protein [Polyangium mundeleinium]|uniref:Cellulose binding domain-containing protein n=1 Tax=Polyangium mundeleinium TaxID=2995306 RepID=A0ABT5EV07_9BACT|nr:cellulose binding domain-containing protein [Polyangium mundeleinium]MDC0745665.1 cellulose binding domain-containing protein [Polyangium mundeleinium]